MNKLTNKLKNKDNSLKLILCLIYLVIIIILFTCSYKLFQEKYKAKPWSEVETVDDYAYIEVSKMSEKFAYDEEKKLGIHFVIEQEPNGLWHTYMVGIKESDYDKYKKIIDYTYKRTEIKPKKVKIYGYPVIIQENLKELAIKNIVNFVSAENEVIITSENFETYLTNSYLDTTKAKKDPFSIILFTTLILLFIMIFLLIYTIIDKNNLIVKMFNKQRRKI